MPLTRRLFSPAHYQGGLRKNAVVITAQLAMHVRMIAPTTMMAVIVTLSGERLG
jgi:hypothetical protein